MIGPVKRLLAGQVIMAPTVMALVEAYGWWSLIPAIVPMILVSLGVDEVCDRIETYRETKARFSREFGL